MSKGNIRLFISVFENNIHDKICAPNKSVITKLNFTSRLQIAIPNV